MTLLLSEVAGLLAGTALWLLVVLAVGTIVGLAVGTAVHRTPPTRTVRVAVISGLLAAGAAQRLGLADPAAFAVMGRPVPPIWVVAGAAIGAALSGVRRGVSGEGSAAIPAPGAGRP